MKPNKYLNILTYPTSHPSKVVDEDTATAFASDPDQLNIWITIDLLDQYSLSHIMLLPRQRKHEKARMENAVVSIQFCVFTRLSRLSRREKSFP